MPRPRPLKPISTALQQHDSELTPRTPQSGSRTSRAEQGFAKLQLIEAEQDEADLNLTTQHDSLQSAPLLASSSTARFTGRARSTKFPPSKEGRGDPAYILSLIFSRVPLAIGVLLAAILLILIVLSLTRPEELHRYVGARPPSWQASAGASTTISASEQKETPEVASSVHDAGHNFNIISYENYTSFPLQPTEYRRECGKLNSGFMVHGDYWDTIGPMGKMDVLHHDESDSAGQKTCSSTITYMLDGMVGLAADLALMAQVAALARERNRTFLVNDMYWNRGKWMDHFEDVRQLQPGPEPGCLPPSPDEFVACPRTARHWIVNSRTAKYHFGHGFADHYEDPVLAFTLANLFSYAHELNRLHPIFDFARQSFDSIIRPNAHNIELINFTRKELLAFIRQSSSASDISSPSSPEPLGDHYLAVHIRRGDRRPDSFRFTNHQIPIETYVKGAEDAWTRLIEGSRPEKDIFPITPVYYVASDSQEAERQFAANVKHGETFSLFTARDARLREVSSPGEYFQEEFAKLTLERRVLATRGALVDLALISGLWARKDDVVPEATVCSISTNLCKLAPIGMGWSRAFGNVDRMGVIDDANKRWVEIDAQGSVVPIWRAFELF